MKLLHSLMSIVVIAGSSLQMLALDVQSSINKFVNSSELRHASVGICIVDMSNDSIIGANAPMQSDISASTMKTVTSATALNLLGRNFTFHTKVIANGEIDKKGHLDGNLIIRGGGDPTLGSRHFGGRPNFVEEIIRVLKENEITQIKGDVIIDDSLYPYSPVSGYWMLEDTPCDYGTGIHALNFADNTFRLQLQVAPEGVSILGTTPPLSYITFNNRIKVIGENDSNLNDTGVMMQLDHDFNTFQLYGNVRPRTKVSRYSCANPSPSIMLRDSIMAELHRNEIKVKNKEIEEEQLACDTTLLDYKSPRLADIITSLLKRSDNMFTEGVLRAIAVNSGMQGTAENGVKAVKRYWKNQGLDVSGLFMYDGSGLARNNKVNASFFTSMLSATERISSSTLPFSTLMPRIGGGNSGLLSSTSFAKRFALKSGSMTGVLCYVGYFPADAPHYALALLVNNYNCSRSRLSSMIESLLVEIGTNIDAESDNK